MPIPPDLGILYPNGETHACQMFIWDGSKPILWDGSVSVSVTSSGSAIQDGVDSTIRATVFNYTNSKPLAIIAVDTTGQPTGGSAVSIANGSDVCEGNTGDPAVVGDTTGTVSAKLRGINKALANPLHIINDSGLVDTVTLVGTVTTVSNVTTVGTVTTVSAVTAITNALPAGTNVIGHVIVDSGVITTVSAVTAITNALPAGTNVIGHVIVDSGVITTVSAVTAITNALPTGTNSIGQVTANAGTNLNTSALALEAGNLATIAGIVTSSRAAVNPVVGQAGVAASTGVVTNTTQRVTLATDVALPTGTNVIGHVIVDSGVVTTVTAVTSITNALPAGTNAIGKLVASTPSLNNALSTTAATVVNAAAIWTGYYIYNPNSSVAYVQVFDTTASITLGTTTPKWSMGIPATSAANLAGLRITIAFAMKVAATTTATGSTAPSTALDANFSYE